jgi:hypothetical protein
MVKRCKDCSTTVDSGNLCETCYNEKMRQIPKLKKISSIEFTTDGKIIAPAGYTPTSADRVRAQELASPSNKGTKHDQGKPDLSILPIEALEAMAAAFTYGSRKYARNNFKKGLEVNRTLAAALRHIYAFLNKEDLDPESGESHLAHALAAVAMTVYNIKHNPNMDDR